MLNVIFVTDLYLKMLRLHTRSKKVKTGFWCISCALDKYVITDRQIINFLKKKQGKPRFRNQKVEPYRY